MLTCSDSSNINHHDLLTKLLIIFRTDGSNELKIIKSTPTNIMVGL